jgi:hypothetical protein
MRNCLKLVKARKLLREYKAKKKQRKEKLSSLKLSKPPVKQRKSNKRTSKVYTTKEEARLELELETLTNTLDLEDSGIKICCLLKDIVSKTSLST